MESVVYKFHQTIRRKHDETETGCVGNIQHNAGIGIRDGLEKLRCTQDIRHYNSVFIDKENLL